MHGNDILAIYHGDKTLTTNQGRERIKMIRDCFPEVDDLKRIAIKGPNGTLIYILGKEQHYDLFQNQLRSVINHNVPGVEEVSGKRKRRRHLANRTLLKLATIRRLKKLARWLDEGEIPLEVKLIDDQRSTYHFPDSFWKT
jgi:hypothetical protein